MSRIGLPPDLDAFLNEPNPAVVACIRPDGFPMTVATWYEWQEGLVMVNMEDSRRRLAWMRRDPKLSLTVFDKNWYRHVSLYGVVVRILDDTNLADIDRLSRRYDGRPYANRMAKRVSACIEPKGWHGWDSTGHAWRD